VRLLFVAALLVIAGPATAGETTIEDAFPPTLRFGATSWHARIDRIDIERGGDVLWVSLRIVTRRFPGDDAILPIDVPAGTRILGMQLETDDAVVWGEALEPDHATTRYAQSSQPALLAWQSTTSDIDHLELRVQSVAEVGTTVPLAVELPEAMNLHVEPAELVRVDKQRMRSPIAVFPGAQPAAGRSVGPRTSLVAAKLPRIVFGGGPEFSFGGSLDKAMIRRRVKSHVPVLRHCYELELQKHPDLAGRAELHFTIAEDGHVFDANVDGALPNDAVKTCMTNEVATWTFPAVFNSGGDTAVNYPLELVSAR
jgi:hypothetical protein